MVNLTAPPLPLLPCNSSSTDSSSTAVPSFWIGVIAAIAGSMVLAIGMNLQRLAHLKLQQRSERSNFVCDRTWQLGLLIFGVGNFGDAVALAFAPQSVVTPLGCFSLVANIFSAHFILGEQIGVQTSIGSAIIICGVLAIVYPSSNGVGQCEDEDLDTLLRRWARPLFRTFAICHLLCLLCVLFYVRRLERVMFEASRARDYPPTPTRNADTSNNAASTDVVPHGRQPHVAPAFLPARERMQLRLGYPLLIGLVATWTVLLVKMAGTLLRAMSRDGIGVWGRYESWVMLLGLFLSLPTQLLCASSIARDHRISCSTINSNYYSCNTPINHMVCWHHTQAAYLNRALARFEALFVVPALQCFWSLSSITMGAMFFQEFDLYEPWMYGLFMTGVVVSLAGLVVISTASVEPPAWLKMSSRSFLRSRKGDVNGSCSRAQLEANRASLAGASKASQVGLEPARCRVQYPADLDPLET